VLAGVLALVTFGLALFQPFGSNEGDQVRVVVPPRASAKEIGDILDQAGVVPSGALFAFRAGIGGDGDGLKPGTYYLQKNMTYGDAISRLSAGPATSLIDLTIPEGLSRAEIAPLTRRAGVRGDYREASRRSPVLRPADYGAESRPTGLEGFLFPATYELRRGAEASTLVSKQLVAFKRNFAGVDLAYARRKNLTAFDVVTIASMVEREAQLARERPLVAAVIYNRLHEGQPLAIDATTRYATGNWSRPLTRSELASGSPYNTRTRSGLPPGPIGNPGLASLRAAAHPARVPYLYYVVKPGTCGVHAFSSSFEQFTRDRQRYEAAREAAGGRSPTKCP